MDSANLPLLTEEKFVEKQLPEFPRALRFTSRRIGPYALLSKIGQGGMGSVWLAERTDGEVRRQVAIKVLNAENQDPVWRERFLRERQLLASLNHPSVVHLIDAGHTPGGRPYLVMEYVQGIAIDSYCAGIDISERLRLFLQVCAGISHAHRSFIIHRDLKPSNILVDPAGKPKVLDFGIAKLLDESRDRTHTAEGLLTPDYASPEQMHGAPEGRATDVYSLGAVLYKLLTGRSPRQAATDASGPIDSLETPRKIPPPDRLNPALPSDINYILCKALRTEAEERYPSVDLFAADIQALLEARPVRARSGNAVYRMRKMLRRHWMFAAGAALVLSGLATGSYVANRERTIARERFQEVRELAHTFVFDLYDRLAKLEGSTKARERTVLTGLRYLDNLRKSAGNDLELQKDIAAAYMKIGDAQGFPTHPNLGRIDDALASYRKAGDLYQEIAAQNLAYLPDLARYYLQYAALVRFNHDLNLARALSRSAIETFDRMHAFEGRDPQLKAAYIAAWCTVGDMDEDLGNYRLAWIEFSRCGKLARNWLDHSGGKKALFSLTLADERIGTAAQELGLLPEALAAFNEGEKLVDQLLTAEPRNPGLHRRQAVIAHYRSEVYFSDNSANFGDTALALQNARQYLSRTQQMVANDPNDTAAKFSRAIATYQVSYCQRGTNPDAAVAMARESVRLFDELIATGKKSYLITSRRVRAMIHLAEAELQAKHVREALRTAESSLAGERPFAGKSAAESDEHIALVSALVIAAKANAAAANPERAETLLEEARGEAQFIASTGHELENVIPLANVERVAGAFYASLRRVPEARACFQRLLDLWNRFPQSNIYVERQSVIARRSLAVLGNSSSVSKMAY